MTGDVGQERVRSLFVSGVAAIVEHAARLHDAQWAEPACGEWSAIDVVRHVLGVSRWYHAWLDRALAGDTTKPFDGADIDAQNAMALRELGSVSGADAAAQFEELALSYIDRVSESWDVPYAYPFGLVTAGLHAGVGATEWHLHAWDLSTVGPRRHVPGDAEGLFLAAGANQAAVQGGLRGRIMSLVIPLAARRAPWETILKRSGRRG